MLENIPQRANQFLTTYVCGYDFVLRVDQKVCRYRIYAILILSYFIKIDQLRPNSNTIRMNGLFPCSIRGYVVKCYAYNL